MHKICGHTRNTRVKITEKTIPIIASAFEILLDFCGTGGKLSIPSLSKFVHQQIFSLIDSESDLLIALLWLSSKVTPPNMVLIFFEHET